MKTRSFLTYLTLIGFLVFGVLLASQPPAGHLVRTSLISWAPEAGYLWVDGADSSRGAHWTPGLRNPAVPNVVSGKREGYWNADDGYEFATPGKLAAPRWVAGRPHSTAPHVRSGSLEQQWVAEPGYAFLNQAPGDLRVSMLTPAAPTSPSSVHDDRGERLALTALKFLGGAILGTDDKDDGVVMQRIVRPMARDMRDQSVREAIALLTDK